LASRGRILFRLALFLLLAVAAALVVLTTPWPVQWARGEILRRVEQLSGGRLEIDSLELHFFPPRAVARGIRFAGRDAEGRAIRFACGAADIAGPYRIYFGRFDRIGSVRLHRPVLTIQLNPNPPAAAATSPAPGAWPGIPLVVDRFAVDGGEVRIGDAAAGWEAVLEEASLTGQGTGGVGGPTWEGSLDSGRLSIITGARRVSGRAEAAFRVAGKRADLSGIRFNQESDPFHASGAASLDWREAAPRLQLTADAALARPRAPREVIGDLWGRFLLDLRGESRGDGFHGTAKLRSPALGLAGVRAGEASVEALLGPGRLGFSRLTAKVLGGSVSGEGSLSWEGTSLPRARLEARAALSGAATEEIAGLLPLKSLPVTGRVDHRGEYRMEAFDPATLEGKGEVTLAGRLSQGSRERVDGSCRFRVARSRLEVEEARLKTPTASARFRGSIALPGEGRIDGVLSAAASNPRLLHPLLPELPEAARAPLAEIVDGSPGASLAFDGRVSGSFEEIVLAGKGEAHSLGLRGKRLGDLRSRLTLSRSRLEVQEATLSGGDVTLSFSGSFPAGGTRGGKALEVRGKGEGIELAWLKAWFGVSLPAEGEAAITADLSGRPEELAGRIEWQILHPRLASVPVDSAVGSLSLAPGVVTLEKLVVSRGAGKIEAAGEIGLAGRPIHVHAAGEGIDLAWLGESGLLPYPARGVVRLQAEVAGTIERPTAEIDLETPSLGVKEIDLGEMAAHFSAGPDGGRLQVRPREKGVALDGQVGWGAGLPFEARLTLAQYELAASRLGGENAQWDGSATLSGSFLARGSLKDFSRLDVTGDLRQVALRLGKEQLLSRGPATLRWRPPRLELTPLQLAGPGSEVTLSGEYDPESGSYRFKGEGSLALGSLASLWPGVVADGRGSFSLSFLGSPSESRAEGWLSLEGGRLRGGGLPFSVSSLSGRCVLDAPHGFHLEGVRMDAGGGRILVEGKGTLEGARVTGMDLALRGSDVLAIAPKGFRGRYDLDLRLTQSARGRELGGKINLIRGVYDRDFHLERNLLSFGGGQPVVEEETESAAGSGGWLDTIGLDLALEADRGLWIINDFATLEGTARFHVGGTAAKPEITGRLSALEGGTIRFRMVRYRLERGNIDLIDPEHFNPYLDLLAETTVADYQVTLKIDGSIENFTYELTSNPPLSQPEIVALLVSGRSPNPFLESGRVAQDMASGYLSAGIASGLGGVLQGVTGLDQFSIDPVFLTSQGDPASRVTVGKQISEKLFAAYSTLLTSSSEEIYQLEYRLARDVKFTSSRQADGQLGGDFRYVLRLSTAPGSPDVRPAEKLRVQAIRILGSPGMPTRKLFRLFRVDPGDTLDRDRIADRVDKILKRYRRKDRLQAVVEAREEPVEGDPGRVNVVLLADAGPEVRIRVEGAPHRRKSEHRMRELWNASVFPEEVPEEARSKLEADLREDGYSRAKVEIALPVDTPARREVILKAEAGPRAKVETVEIAGNPTLRTDWLMDFIKTKEGRTLHPGRASDDAARIRSHYLSLGFAEAKVPPPKIDLSPDGTRAHLRFEISEGDPTKIARIRVDGNAAVPEEKLLQGLPLQAGDFFTREKARAAGEAIRRVYDREGYSRAKVSYSVAAEGGPALVYHVDEGPRRFVGRIEIEGNRLTRDEVIRREITLAEGKPLSAQEILKTRRALYRLGVFSAVDIKEVEGEDPVRPTVRILVSETKNLTQALGIGYGTDEGIRGLYEITNSNLLGRARSIGLQLRGSDVNSRVQFLLRDPFLFNRRLDSLLSAFWERRERDSFTLTELGTTLQVSDPHGEKDRTIYRYTLKDENVSDLQITSVDPETESIRLSGLSAAYVHDSRDNFYNPRRGAFATFDLAAYGQAIGSEAAFVKFFSQGSLFRKVWKDSVWAQSIRLGAARPFGISDSIPVSERFFAGGDTTVRGFKFDHLGPRDPLTGEPTGGEALFIINEEFRFPIWKALRGVVFLDAGNVTARLADLDPLDLRTVLGVGLRIETPIGPVRFEYGWKLDREAGETAGELHITVGPAF
jgi:outer membrane protein insertion porin family